MSPLDDGRAARLLAEEFPGRRLDQVWVAVDGRGALARSGASALILCEVGDHYVARNIPWAQAVQSTFRDGVLKLDLSDVAAPQARLALQSWPPMSSVEPATVRFPAASCLAIFSAAATNSSSVFGGLAASRPASVKSFLL